LTKLKQYIRSD